MDTQYFYEIRIEGHLSETWANRLCGLTFSYPTATTTLLSGSLVDQASLFGVLVQLRNLGLTLVSVKRSDSPQNHHTREETHV